MIITADAGIKPILIEGGGCAIAYLGPSEARHCFSHGGKGSFSRRRLEGVVSDDLGRRCFLNAINAIRSSRKGAKIIRKVMRCQKSSDKMEKTQFEF